MNMFACNDKGVLFRVTADGSQVPATLEECSYDPFLSKSIIHVHSEPGENKRHWAVVDDYGTPIAAFKHRHDARNFLRRMKRNKGLVR